MPRELVAALELNGASVTTAASAAEAVERLGREHPDILVSDVTMPEDDGYVIIRRIRGLETERGGRVPTAAVTDDAATPEGDGTLRAAYQMHLTRPVEARALVAALAKLAAVGVL